MKTISCSEQLPPKQEVITYGALQISTPRLLSIVLGRGSTQQPVHDLADSLLQSVGGISALSEASLAELCSVAGIGEVLATRLIACFQLARRARDLSDARAIAMRGPEDVCHHLRTRLGTLRQEVFMVLALDVRGRIQSEIEVARGSLSSVSVHPREVFRPLIRRSAYACVVAHNHPSGDPTPSEDDVRLTYRLRDVGQLVGIELLDHVVITEHSYSSMADRLHGAVTQSPTQLPDEQGETF